MIFIFFDFFYVWNFKIIEIPLDRQVLFSPIAHSNHGREAKEMVIVGEGGNDSCWSVMMVSPSWRDGMRLKWCASLGRIIYWFLSLSNLKGMDAVSTWSFLVKGYHQGSRIGFNLDDWSTFILNLKVTYFWWITMPVQLYSWLFLSATVSLLYYWCMYLVHKLY